ncbi:MAG: alpha/beta hydrolase [Pseudomonadota bacterium]|nr:alpha/beta hydrolase [Pseudomonadota bacterium]
MKTGQSLRGAARLAFDAVDGVTNIVEDMYRNIAAASPPIGEGPTGSARGIAGFVHATIRGINGITRESVDLVLGQLAESLDDIAPPGPGREAVVSALNGVVGDYLLSSDNPLALTMQWRQFGSPLPMDRDELRLRVDKPSRHLLITVHGLCMNDRQWTRNGHNHGAYQARRLGASQVDLFYNTGRHISHNGRDLATQLEALVAAWPVKVRSIRVLAHSMGGLVTRSALSQAQDQSLQWPALVSQLVFLGTPHLGAPLERGGNWVDTLGRLSPYTAPIARLGWLRSAGITDLRHGYTLDSDWQGRDRFERSPHRPELMPLPPHVRAVAAAGTLGARRTHLLGDGLVPVNSALGQTQDGRPAMAWAESGTRVFARMNHWDLLDDPRVTTFLDEQLH